MIAVKFVRPYRYDGVKRSVGEVAEVKARDAVILKALHFCEDAPRPTPPMVPNRPPHPENLPADLPHPDQDPPPFPPVTDLPPLLPGEPKPEPKKPRRKSEGE